MRDGAIVSTHFPYLPLTVRVRGQSAVIEALLDTGFDGDIVVPQDFVNAGEPPDGYLHWTLADGSQVEAAAYLGTAVLGSYGPFDVVINALGDEPIVGRSFSDRFTITLDHGHQVIVEP
jgi:predicted aspartyl protease